MLGLRFFERKSKSGKLQLLSIGKIRTEGELFFSTDNFP